MTVQELTDKLATLDPNAQVEIAIRTYTDKYPKAYIPARFAYRQAPNGDLRLDADLPQGMTVSQRKLTA